MNSDLKIVSGHQPVYLPWLGLFHKLYLSDVFVYMDTVQYLTNDWNNRNKIKTSQNSLMLTVPIDKKKSRSSKLNDIRIFNENKNSRDFWQKKHWESIKINYSKAPFFNIFKNDLEFMYMEKEWNLLIDLCWYQFNYFRKILGLGEKKIIRMSETTFSGQKDDLVLDHCKKLNCNAVVFGEMGKNYVNLEKFNKNKILVYYQKYIHPIYSQQYSKNGFTSNLSVIDLILNEGPENSMKIFKSKNLTVDDISSVEWVNRNNI